MNNPFTKLYKQFVNHKILFTLYLLVIVVFILLFAPKLKFNEDISAIIPNDERITGMTDLVNNSSFASQIILHFYASDSNVCIPDSLLYYAKKIALPLEADTQYVKNVLFNISTNVYTQLYDFFYIHLPFYLDDNDYVELAKRTSPEGIEYSLQQNLKSLLSPAGVATQKYIFKDPLNIVPMAIKRLENFKIDDNFIIYQSAIFTKDKKHLLVFIDPVFRSSNTEKNATLIHKIDSLIALEVTAKSQIKAEYYGGTAVAVANATVIKTDIMLTVSIAFLALLVFFFVLFRQLRVFVLMFVPVLFGAGFALALLYLFKGQISAIALGIGAVLLGISIDYSLHFFAHLRSSQSMLLQLKELPEPIFMSSLTTASTFLCLLIIKSEALNELGLFAAVSVLLSAFFVLTILPILIPKKIYTKIPNKHRNTLFDKITHYEFEKNKTLTYSVVLLSVIFLFFAKNIRFNSDISSLNYLSENLKVAEKNIEKISTATLSSIFLISSDTSWNSAVEKTETLDSLFFIAKQKQLISGQISLSKLILSEKKQKQKIKRWNDFWKGKKPEEIKKILIEKGEKTYFKPNAFEAFYALLDKKFEIVKSSDFQPIVKAFARNYMHESDSLFSIISVAKVPQEKKKDFFDFFENKKEVNIIDKQFFTNRFFEVLHTDFNRLVNLSLFIVFVILLLFFGRIELAIITFIPILLSWVWVLGLMNIFGLEFNIFNIIISTFIFGLGIDYCIFTMRGLLNNYKYGERSLQPFRLSILLSAITTILGIGVLIFARHLALKSIALVSIFGIVSVVAIAYILLPTLFHFLILFKKKKRVAAVTLVSFYTSNATLILFLTGTIISILLFPILYLLPIRKKQKKYIYHSVIQKVLYAIIYAFPALKKRFINKEKLDFKKPSILLANHQSHIDLAMILLLHPKIIVLTNKWVWNSPFFKILVRYADYIPAFQGIDTHFQRLQQKVKQGYSVLIFPEGTRSEDGKIRRFHQGAFYLADKLNLEIQPILQYGLQEVMPKKEFFIHSGVTTLKIFDRVSIEKRKEGKSYRKEAKAMTQFYREEYAKLSQEIENCNYAAKKLINKFIYKGPVLEWYCRVKLSLEKNYTFFESQISKNATITDLGCGYGFLAIILKMTGKERKIYGLDYDQEKISVAKKIAKDYEHLHFEEEDITQIPLRKSDVFIISDTLHYMPENEQITLIERCIKNLNPNGKLIIRDADSSLEKRTRVTKFTEFLSTRIFQFNQTKKFKQLNYTNSLLISKIASKYKLKVEQYDFTKNTSNIIYILKATEDEQ